MATPSCGAEYRSAKLPRGTVERVDEGGMHASFPHVRLGRRHQVEQIDQCAVRNFDHLFHNGEYGTLNPAWQRMYHSIMSMGRVWSDSGNVMVAPSFVVISSET